MPVLSPHRSATGSYRSSYSTSSIDRPYYTSSSSYLSPRTSYSERFTTRSCIDTDGRRIYSRSGSITEDGVTTRFREEFREDSIRRDSSSRDSGISSIRENSILDIPRRDSSISRLASPELSISEMRNKYSPANYIPACQRKNDNISRSKSINDIGLPPVERLELKKKVNVGLNNVGLSINSTNTNHVDNSTTEEDDNGNRASVAEIRKKFDVNAEKPIKNGSVLAETNGIKIADNRFKKQDHGKLRRSRIVGDKNHSDSPPKDATPDISDASDKTIVEVKPTKLKVTAEQAAEKDGRELGRSEEVVENGVEMNGVQRNSNHVTNFASFIPNKNYQKGDDTGASDHEEGEGNTDTVEGVRGGQSNLLDKDITTSPRLNRNVLSQPGTSNSLSTNNITSNNILRDRNSLDRDRRDGDDDRGYLSAPSIKQMGLNGLKNIGNTCFMNSVIQCLSNTKLLLEYVRKDEYTSEINSTVSSMKGALIKAFAQVIKELWSEDSFDRVVNTLALKSQIQRFAPRFMGYAQQDAQEFLRYLLEGLHEDVNRVIEKPKPILTEIDEKLSDHEKAAESWQRYLRMDNSKIVDIFVGQLKSTLKCTHCGHCSVTFDPFWDLSLPIPQRAGQLRLSQCLDHFTREETLDGDEKPTCSKCKERRKCTKSFSIQKFPRILVIHLKRFSPTERFRGKLNITIDFPLEGLDMKPYAADSVTECRYNLYAISNHSGTTYSGHYTAYCKHPYSHAWHEYNDSRVSSISSKSLVSGEAYVLFYELENQKSHL